MTTSNFDFKSELSNISNALDGTPLAQDALGVFNQRTAGLFSLFQNAEQLISGIQNLTQIDNHGGSNVFLGTGITKLTENVPGFEEDLKTDVSSAASDLFGRPLRGLQHRYQASPISMHLAEEHLRVLT